MSATCACVQPILLFVLRIATTYLFLLYNAVKFFGFLVVMSSGPLGGLMLVAGILEIVSGILLTPGLFTRPVAFTLFGQIAVTYFMIHAVKGSALFPLVNSGESVVLFCFAFFYLAATGGSLLASDNLFGKNKA